MDDKMNFILMRHGYDDHSYIDGRNDTSLTERGVLESKQAAGALIMRVANQDQIINIYSSSKKRATETSEIVSEQFDRYKIPYTYSITTDLNELYQGSMLLDGLSHKEKVELLQSAWEAFDEKRVENNYNYKFGEPHAKLLREFVDEPYGESQNEFSLRIARRFQAILNDYDSGGGYPIVITHRGGIREIQNMTHAFNNQLPMNQSEVCEMSGLRYNEIIENTVINTQICIASLKRYVTSLNKNMTS